MTPNRDPDLILRKLSAAARRRRRDQLSWLAVAIAAALLFLIVTWEALVGPVFAARVVGYLVVGGGAAYAIRRGVRSWRWPGPGHREIVDRLGRLFPQTRGGLTALVDTPGVGMDVARRARSARWLTERASPIDATLASVDRRGIVYGRWFALVMVGVAGLVSASHPAAALRVLDALRDPASVWNGAGAWTVSPGDADVGVGDPVTLRASFVGPAYDGVLEIEWREGEASWASASLSNRPTGARSWSSVTGDFDYRFRYGPFTTRLYRIRVRSPVALVRVESRRQDEPWAPLAGQTLPADELIEIRGVASHPIETAAVVVEGRDPAPLEVDGASFSGRVRLRPGAARIVVMIPEAGPVSSGVFTVTGTPPAFVELLAPSGDPVILESVGAWFEVRAGSLSGLREIGWETADERGGTLADVLGARDTTLAALVRLGADRAPGDSFRFRVVARPTRGAIARSPWRMAVMASRASFEAAAEEERRAAGREFDRALEQARRAERGEIDAGTEVSAELDAGLRAAADSLAAAIERTLADPELDPALAERLASSRRLLRGATETDLRPRPGLPDDARAQLTARASVLEAVRREMAEVERLVALAAAADTLSALADAERALAADTRAGDRVDGEVTRRQGEIDAAVDETAAVLPDSLGDEVRAAMDVVEVAVGDRDPAALADAQDAAAVQLAMAADEARETVEDATRISAERRLAIDRAGAEALFLAERQRAVADRLKSPARTSREQADRVASQTVIVRGLEAALGALVEAIGGRPAGIELAARLAEAVFSVKYAEEAIADPPVASGVSSGHARAAAEDAATALALLSRAFLVPEGGTTAAGGQGAEGPSGAAAQQMEAMADAERALADALASGDQPAGGNPEAAAEQREVGRQLEELGAELLDAGIDPRTIERLAESVEATARRLERGLAGAQAQTDLQALARRFADLGRIAERASPERRQSETARAFIPEAPPRLPERVTAPRLDPEVALDPWRPLLPRGELDTARAFLDALAAEGVRSQESAR